jgi:hypothetical protein
VTIRTMAEERTILLEPRQARDILLNLGEGFPYEGRWVWSVSISSAEGFVPMFDEGGTDVRYLGVLVKPELEP